jgi:hypothetical protein
MIAKKTTAQNAAMPPATNTKDMLSEDALDKVTGGRSASGPSISEIVITKYFEKASP